MRSSLQEKKLRHFIKLLYFHHPYYKRMMKRLKITPSQIKTREDLKKFHDLFEDSSEHLDDAAHLKENNLKFHLMLAKASGNPVLSIMLESVFELLIEQTQDSVVLSVEKHFFYLHKKIFRVIEENRPDEAERLIKEDILDVRKKIKTFKSNRLLG